MNTIKLNTIGTPCKAGGNSGGGGGGSSNYIYYDQKRSLMNIRSVWEFSQLVKVNINDSMVIIPLYSLLEAATQGVDVESLIVAVCIDLNLRVTNIDTGGISTMEEILGDSVEYMREVSITEEEFYTL